jgi:hypothetical protein
MSELDRERQRHAEELLLRSAQLDAPRADRRARALARVMVEAHSNALNRRTRTLGLVAASLAVAAGVAFFARGKLQPSREQVRPEAPPGARAPGPPASASETPEVALAPCPKLVVAKGGAPMIDDWEDRNARLLIADGREGTWMVYNDGSGKQVPPGLSPMHPVQLVPARGQSHYALHTSGEKLSIWGSTVVGSFTDGGCYDMSAYRGVAFWAKGNTRIYAQLAVIDEVSKESGGLCAGTACYTSPSKAFDLGPRWQEYVLTFAELERLNAPPRFRFDPKRVTSFNFAIHREDTPFDVWMDDVRFIESE